MQSDFFVEVLMLDGKDLRVAVLFGGQSAEHDVSVSSAQMAIESLAGIFQLLPVYLDREGRWRIPAAGFDAGDPIATSRQLMTAGGPAFSAGGGLARLEDLGTRVVFLALHGPYGEDGRIQGLLETANIAYTGSDVLGSAIAMDKAVAKRLYDHAGLTIATSRTISAAGLRRSDGGLDGIVEAIGLPLVVKPVSQGSSVGTTICRTRGALLASVHKALEHGGAAMLEQFIEGRELTCGVLDFGDGQRCALPPTLIRPKSAEFFDYKAKYEPGATEEITPAPVSAELIDLTQRTALRAHAVLQLRGYSRTDMIERDGKVYVLETNTLPGLTRTSLLPQAARAAGLSVDELLQHLVLFAAGMESVARPEDLKGCLVERTDGTLVRT